MFPHRDWHFYCLTYNFISYIMYLYKLKIRYGGVMIKKISKIEKVQCDSFLYDIEVENTNNFFADGLLVHNCKMDGMRFNAIVKFDRDLKGTVEFRSRNGKEISLLGSLEEEFIDLAYGKDLVFDGELLVYDTVETDSNGKICDRQTGNGILNKAVKGTISKQEADRVVATLWDQIPYEDFIAGKCDQPYRYRLKRLDYLLARLPSETKIELVETFEVHSLEQTQTIFQNYLDDGDEGIILKDPNSLWENKRSKGQIKFKAVNDSSLQVISVIGGTGKYADMIGSLYCESSDGIIKVYVGSGFSDEQRNMPPSEYYGKIISVKYNAKIQAKTGEWSLFLPIFDGVRLDQDSADVFSMIV